MNKGTHDITAHFEIVTETHRGAPSYYIEGKYNLKFSTISELLEFYRLNSVSLQIGSIGDELTVREAEAEV